MNKCLRSYRHGKRGDREYWTRFAVFRKRDVLIQYPGMTWQERLEAMLDDVFNGWWGVAWRGSGGSFKYETTLRHGGSRVLVVQSGGLDI